MEPEECEEQALQCLRLVQDRVDPDTIALLKGLAQEYTALAVALRIRESNSAQTGAEGC